MLVKLLTNPYRGYGSLPKTTSYFLGVVLLSSLLFSTPLQAQAPRLVGWDNSESSSVVGSMSPKVSSSQGYVGTSSSSAPRLSGAATPSANQIAPRRSNQACWDEAARYHGLDPWLLYAVAYVESTHNPSVISKPNRNGTYDIGLMQINSVHLPRLAKYGITQTTLMDACASTYVGAWIMSDNIRRFGWSWEAIAAYNVGSLNTPARRRIGKKYAGKVYTAYGKLSGNHQSAPIGVDATGARSMPPI